MIEWLAQLPFKSCDNKWRFTDALGPVLQNICKAHCWNVRTVGGGVHLTKRSFCCRTRANADLRCVITSPKRKHKDKLTIPEISDTETAIPRGPCCEWSQRCEPNKAHECGTSQILGRLQTSPRSWHWAWPCRRLPPGPSSQRTQKQKTWSSNGAKHC